MIKPTEKIKLDTKWINKTNNTESCNRPQSESTKPTKNNKTNTESA